MLSISCKSLNQFKYWLWSASGLDKHPVDWISGCRPPRSDGNPREWPSICYLLFMYNKFSSRSYNSIFYLH